MRREGHAATAAILTAEEVAGPQRVSPRTAYRFNKNPTFPCLRYGKVTSGACQLGFNCRVVSPQLRCVVSIACRTARGFYFNVFGDFPRQDGLTGLERCKCLIRRRLSFLKVQRGRPWKRVQNGLFHSLSVRAVDRPTACYDCSLSCYWIADHLAYQQITTELSDRTGRTDLGGRA